jgi:Phosphoserine phosphatase RsbU, N-terminal domain
MDALSALRQNYASAFVGYLSLREETGLRAAYELGRGAMADGISILDLVEIHHEVLLDNLAEVKNVQELTDIGRAGAAFLVEALASFEMTRREFIAKTPDSTGDV